jgi:23S rRNA (guanine745-N1)-methyltransferase
VLICTVRGCGRPLARADASLVCARGHAYDVSRSGYVNLLQPQDRRSRHPGDTAEAVRARRRIHEAGLEEWLVDELAAEADSALKSSRSDVPAILDVGCGDGYFLGELARRRTMDAHGVDISRPAIDVASRAYPGASWVVANADRMLPWADGSFDLVLSITSRRHAPEIRRVLAPSGRALFVLPAEDDLIELRESALGRAVRRDRVAPLVSALAGSLALVSRRGVRRCARLNRSQLEDLLSTTYRTGRVERENRVGRLTGLDVTMSRELLLFRPA